MRMLEAHVLDLGDHSFRLLLELLLCVPDWTHLALQQHPLRRTGAWVGEGQVGWALTLVSHSFRREGIGVWGVPPTVVTPFEE